MKSPYWKWLLLIEKTRPEKLGFPPRAAISGVIRSLISACTTWLKATPTTTATARSIRLPCRRNFLKPVIRLPSAVPGAAVSGALSGARCRRRQRDRQVVTVPALGRRRWPCGQSAKKASGEFHHQSHLPQHPNPRSHLWNTASISQKVS